VVVAGADRPDEVAPVVAAVIPRDPVLLVATRDEAAGAGLRVAGLTIIDRSVKQLARAGYSIVIASDGAIPLPALPAGAVVRKVASAEDVRALEAELGDPPTTNADIVRPKNGRELTGGLRVTDAASRRGAEDAIFRQLLRGDLGLVARWLNKPVSFRITRYLLCKLPFTPNQVTLGAALVGLVGCALIATGTWTGIAIGFVLAHVQSVLDGCDGELARVRFQQSAIGEWLDTVVDDALNLAIAASLGIGMWRAHDHAWPWLAAGFTVVGMFLTYNIVAYRMLIAQGEGGEVLKVRWWFAKGKDSKKMAEVGTKSIVGLFYAMGRRDFFCFAAAVLAISGLGPAILGYMIVTSGGNFVVAAGQLISWARG
jgi:phosphatidylglycerophosphate synthase